MITPRFSPNAFHNIFPDDMLLQCFPHIIRKFRIDGAREGNGVYYQHMSDKNSPSWLYDVAENDVCLLRECRTPAMFKKMSSMVLAGWRADGEDALADTFSSSYLVTGIIVRQVFLDVYPRTIVMKEVTWT